MFPVLEGPMKQKLGGRARLEFSQRLGLTKLKAETRREEEEGRNAKVKGKEGRDKI
jgi:hypothetical protein